MDSNVSTECIRADMQEHQRKAERQWKASLIRKIALMGSSKDGDSRYEYHPENVVFGKLGLLAYR